MSKNTIEGTTTNFKTEALESELPVLVDFWAPWCGPCRAVAPVLEEFGGQFAGKVKVVKVNTEDQQALAGQFQIRSIPTLMAFYKGKMVGRMAGFGGKDQLKNLFTELADLPDNWDDLVAAREAQAMS